jgi:crotonobetainyl-CoA:carnitine CoA-transferase CaiB-like acyl-CoA transferase
MKDLLEDECLKARGFWTEVERPELGMKIKYPKQFLRSSEADLSVHFPAPLIGEHNGEIYQEIGITEKELASLKEEGII